MGFLTPPAAGERAVLRTFVLQQFAQLRTTVHGLDDAQAHATPTVSALNLTGLLRHCGAVAVWWSACACAAPEPPQVPDGMEDRMIEELVADASPLGEALDFFDRCVRITARNFDDVTDLSALVPVPDAPWLPKDIDGWEARWCLTHIIAELARHAGHADLIREAIDGKGSYELNDLVDSE